MGIKNLSWTVIHVGFPEINNIEILVVNNRTLVGKDLKSRINMLRVKHPDRSVWTLSEIEELMKADPNDEDLLGIHRAKMSFDGTVIGAINEE